MTFWEKLRQECWRQVMVFAYRRMRIIARIEPVGIPGRRDPENPCHGFEPRRAGDKDWGHCQGDGHYLCQECAHLEAPEELDEDPR